MAQWLFPLPKDKYIYSARVNSNDSVHKGNHSGVDIVKPVRGAIRGTPVLATRSGKVLSAANDGGWHGGAGNYVKLDHGDGYYSIYYHLEQAYVSRGNTVSAGQTIGTVGTTGNSTGYHLHFEIRYGGERGQIIDPESLVSITGDMITATSIAESTGYNDDPVDLAIVGERVSNLTSQPMYAYYEIYIGDKLISMGPNLYQSFEITRYMGAGDTATFTVFDDTWDYLERDFAENWDNIHIRYGYQGSDINSELYNMLLQNYSISFNSTGVILTVSALSQGSYQNMNPVNISTNTKNPTEAVRKIAQYMNWDVREENLDATQDIEDMANPFTVLNDYPVTYIVSEILPQAISPDGEVMQFYLDTNNVVYFKKKSFITESDTLSSTSEAPSKRTYIYQKGYDSTILDLTFDIKAVFGGTSEYGISSGLRTSVFDTDTKEQSDYKEDATSVSTDASGEYIHIKPTQSIPNTDSAGDSPTQAKYRLYYNMKRSMTEHYEATMVLIGDPTIKLLDNIRIINVTDEGYLHHTSGIYMITSIVDSINNGQMTTTLKLVRNGDIEEGVEIISPKLVVR